MATTRVRQSLAMERIEAPSLGIDGDSAPDALAKGKAPVLQNMLPGYAGLIRMRGPLLIAAPFLTANPADKIAGILHHGDTLLVPIREGHATRTREHHTAWYRRGTAATLSRAATTMYVVNMLDGTSTAVVVTRATAPGPRYARQRRYLYSISYDSNTDAGTDIYDIGAANTWVIRRTFLVRYDTQGAPAIPVSYADTAPRGGQDVKVHYNRLFIAGGPSATAAGVFLTDIEPNTLWYSQDLTGAAVNANGDLKAEVARWQHPITVADNKIVVDSADPSDFLVALAKVGKNLAIFKRNSIHVLYGYGPSTFAVRQIAKGIGCLDPRSIVEVENGCFFLSKEGYYFFDGAQLTNMSRGIDQALQQQAIAMVGDAGVDGGLVSAAKLNNEYIGLAVSDATFTLSGGVRTQSAPKIAALLNVPNRAWMTFTSDVLVTDSQPTWFARTDTRAVATDDTAAWEMSRTVAPLTATEAQRGYDGDSTSSFFLDAGTVFSGTGNTLITGAREAWTTGTGLVPIPTSWKSRLIRLGTPGQRAQLHRILIDYRFIPDGQISPGAETGWRVTVYDGDNNVIVPEYQVPIQADPPTEYSRARHRKDAFAEVTDLYVKIEWLGPQQALAYADILDVFVEYQITREYH